MLSLASAVIVMMPPTCAEFAGDVMLTLGALESPGWILRWPAVNGLD